MRGNLFDDASSPSKKIGIDEQIECIQRELALRHAVYPKRVSAGKMTEKLACKEVDRMEAVLKTLLWVSDHKNQFLQWRKTNALA